MSKRKRDFQASHQPQVKHYIADPPKVDSFAAMLAASRAQTQSQASSSGAQSTTSRDIVGCYHCSHFEPGTDNMRQCCKCQEGFCSLCSVPDYQQHDVRYFCLDCKGL
ncbi:hypothetical protein ABBQ32_004932 [Trebouxia sp. C0010 RCD-2024]